MVAVESIGEQDLESFSNELFARWGIGQKENNNGVLVLFVLDQRKIRFEVGYGMEGILPDAVCKRIQSQYMLPAFRQGDYDLGMVQGINRMCSIIENPGNREEVYANATVEEGDWLFLIEMYLGLSVLFSIVMMLMMRTPQQGGTNPSARYKALENQLPTLKIMAVIFPLFNLFIYLSVRNRMYKLRNAKRTCENCGHSMHKLKKRIINSLRPKKTPKKSHNPSIMTCGCATTAERPKSTLTPTKNPIIPNVPVAMHTHIRSKAIGYYLRQLLFKADSEKKGIVAGIAISKMSYLIPCPSLSFRL